jgi:periodic tryptophan protein 2
LLKKFQISHNRSLDGILDYLNSKDLSEAGPMDMIDHDSEDEEEDEHDLAQDRTLPGVQSGYYSNKKKRPVIRTRCVRFSPTGRQWSVISTEGLLIYSLDEQYMFDPYQLDVDVTPDNILKTLKQKLYLKALIVRVCYLP